MLTTGQLRQVAGRSGARDIGNVEIDVILTHLLQLFSERGVTEHLAFKGGTMLRKMIFGPRGRLSTDLDFTCRTQISTDDLMLMMLDALQAPYHGLSFRFDKDKDWYLIEEGCAANPVCAHAENERGVKIKLQVSTREFPVLPVLALPQIEQDYFKLLGFAPAAVPCLAFEEVVAEKIRAASQRSKIRDLHDLSELAARPLNRDLIRSLAVLKLWNSGGPGLDYERFRTRIMEDGDYDVADLTNLLRKDQRPDLDATIRRVVDGFRFLSDLTPPEQALVSDNAQRRRKEADALITSLVQTAQ
ncbi:nucleotidyl transferase AbiEii/AbiGii toxin family protein [Vineibacter terrae]|uniref:Nucleotidyl transferase AbiEii/AbiGii toxin family protein n=1 Tax=Vineibacter terrae TaxID=2586908 RepID=A0A5C8PLQ9_9HYPH|nr:nucleotidyl transferase AbiEii/AbiGii toxin family protein [Vineibacter terrae]TXL75144.1 nucleotidyl transferase AbiEii/AbiGii toxin family protein [Vineibacter terrae]